MWHEPLFTCLASGVAVAHAGAGKPRKSCAPRWEGLDFYHPVGVIAAPTMGKLEAREAVPPDHVTHLVNHRAGFWTQISSQRHTFSISTHIPQNRKKTDSPTWSRGQSFQRHSSPPDLLLSNPQSRHQLLTPMSPLHTHIRAHTHTCTELNLCKPTWAIWRSISAPSLPLHFDSLTCPAVS